jgi:hypothetical protein
MVEKASVPFGATPAEKRGFPSAHVLNGLEPFNQQGAEEPIRGFFSNAIREASLSDGSHFQWLPAIEDGGTSCVADPAVRSSFEPSLTAELCSDSHGCLPQHPVAVVGFSRLSVLSWANWRDVGDG